MNKLYLTGIVTSIVMLAATYKAITLTKGGLNDDMVNMIAIAGAIVIFIATAFVTTKYFKQMQDDKASGELAKESWDGIGEYKNPPPIGWAVVYVLLMVWGMWYWTIGYPVNSYSQIGEYNEDVAKHDAKFNEQHKNITGDRLVEMGESVFLAECKVCHGLSADGIDGKAADLNVRLEEATVKHAIMNGSNNSLLGMEMPMPDRNGLFNMNTNELISDAEIDLVSKYVANGLKGDGADVFAGTCASCHGGDGKGIDFVAPDLAEFTPQLVQNILNHGKKGHIGTMPKFDRLNEKQKEALGAYLVSISAR
ncbi:MAG: c-type cytochrome [Sulfuricurvum sp.]